jgi:hypothetical protein
VRGRGQGEHDGDQLHLPPRGVRLESEEGQQKVAEGRKIRVYVNIPTFTGHSNTHALTITNISLSGCFLRTDMWLNSGTKVSLAVPLGGGKVFELEGMVVRHHEEPKGYGIRFYTLPDEMRRELALLIAETVE